MVLSAFLLSGCETDHGTAPQSPQAQISGGPYQDMEGFTLIRRQMAELDSLPAPSDDEAETELAKLGVSDYRIEGKYVLIDGDFWMDKSQLTAEPVADSAPKPLAKTAQRYLRVAAGAVSPFHTYKYWIDPAMPQQWKSAVELGFREWSNQLVYAGDITFAQTTRSDQANIRIYRHVPSILPDGVCASSSWPTGQHLLGGYQIFPGHGMWIPSACDSYPIAAKNLIAVHEIGHLVGFAHTDVEDKNSYWIPRTLSKDSRSVMNSHVSYFSKWRGFSLGDLEAIQLIYRRSGE